MLLRNEPVYIYLQPDLTDAGLDCIVFYLDVFNENVYSN